MAQISRPGPGQMWFRDMIITGARALPSVDELERPNPQALRAIRSRDFTRSLFEAILDLANAHQPAFLVLGARLGAADADGPDNLVACFEDHAAGEGQQIRVGFDPRYHGRVGFRQRTHLRRRHL